MLDTEDGDDIKISTTAAAAAVPAVAAPPQTQASRAELDPNWTE